ncbi:MULTISPECIES: ShlB/FhaC/HecB family hemolysin secretion/activation protein [unclassified Undibacterium]|uniref:ShlB/FhaC/HecB family hemolysin secretion/activation protein n=1 Tax=unclassified Undibacterium TaxID=2630295 RepID=UPI002AC94B4F|nr:MULTISPECIES: ShlB/FhaC/HecB family hemolysin secretion/activation protein [unclassified Undibacterium]MEB0141180.1 ShlB/FhaC/HecB family hemolysin secretion/activation protein [Undibacterium sp. CCC2.1]MEB0174217.1 ShlB/FhaC/HecB family hemolysin secretion/activation protein [Undibacterium sp. CCC1.1]MEB0178161.1 ShlB/FhaC/HecB family hemolysin secretion/activation protein [Undibacterium sp. CCC3.4]MEB0217389.1 ShlB/FhaC/HecB family hemolysin secretion/activation protein [Undibacterium sp. 
MKKFIVGFCLSHSLFIVSSVAADVAAPVPNQDAQEQIRQQQRLQQLRQQQEIQTDAREEGTSLKQAVPLASDRIPDNETPCFQIDKIDLNGDGADQFQFALDKLNAEVFSIAAAQSSANSKDGLCLGVNGINALMARMQNTIIAKGYITTRVLAAPQDLKSGHLLLTVVNGRVNRVRFTADSDPRASSWNALPLHPGVTLNLRDIEQALENLKRLPSADADIQIEPAAPDQVAAAPTQPGLSDLLISYHRVSSPVRFSWSLDDSGSSATGKYQASATLSGDNLFKLNDLFYVSFNHDVGGEDTGAHGTSAHTWHYSLAYGYWLLSTTTSSNDYYQTVAGASQNYTYSGKSQNTEIMLSRLLFRNNVNKTVLSARAMFRSSSNFIDDTEVEVQRRRVAAWELGFKQTWYHANTVLDYQLNYRHGTGARGALSAPEENFGNGTSRMQMLTADLQLSMPFMLKAPWGQQALQYLVNFRGQNNYTPLTPQDRFSIGSRYSVRGFDGAQSLLSDSGWFIQNNLIVPLGQSGQSAYLGLDYGAVSGQSAALLIGKKLAGMVLGVRGEVGTAVGRFNYDVFVGQAIYKPEGYITSPVTAGFNLNWSY